VVLPLVIVLPLARAAAAGTYSWPVQGAVVRGFERPTGPYGEGGHQGIDIAAAPGTTVRAAGDGTVCWVGELPRGRFVTVTHAGATRTTYLDLDAVSVAVGQRVSRGQGIGTLCGGRDASSAVPHLHFDAYMNGTPVDPRLLFSGLEVSSFLRLCPAGDGEEAAPAPRAPPTPEEGFWSKAFKPIKTVATSVGGGLRAAWRGVSAGGAWVGSGFAQLGKWIAHSAAWCWSNRYVQAVIAGLASAAVIIAAIVLVVITLPVSVICGVVAGIAACVACLGIAIYYAATHASGFSFGGCFLKSLSGGAAIAATVISVGSLGAAFSAGWAEMGLLGAGKCALANGVLSAIFEGSTSYLFTGRVSVTKVAVAFVIGAISGPVSKAIKDGVVGSRLVQALLVSVSEGRLAVTVRTAVLFLKQSGEFIHVMVTFLKEGATAFGGKAVYLLFTGTFAVSCNLASSFLNHKPITLSGLLASFVTGIVMGGIGLMFGGKGLEGFVSNFGLLEGGVAKVFRSYSFRLINKVVHKSVSSGLQSLFKKLFHDSEAPLAKEE